ncbi:MAG: type II secretion system protein GspE, partial [Synergistaceae bacterium]|nr:type II secretion system protein GspE [Synergistaceae bacterium]
PRCKEEYEIDEAMCERLGVPSGSTAFKPVGCQACRQGYRGRRGIYEIMALNDHLREMIIKGADAMELRNAAINDGMKTLRQAGINAALSGYTSLEEILSATI